VASGPELPQFRNCEAARGERGGAHLRQGKAAWEYWLTPLDENLARDWLHETKQVHELVKGLVHDGWESAAIALVEPHGADPPESGLLQLGRTTHPPIRRLLFLLSP